MPELVFVIVPLYFIALIAAVVTSWQLMRRAQQQVNSTPEQFISPYSLHWIKHSFIALFCYFLINLLAESTAWSFTITWWPNYAVYSFNYALNLLAIFIFFAIHVNNRLFSLFLLIVYAGFVYVFIDHQLWINSQPIPFTFGLVLFSGMSVIAIIFLAASLISHSQHPNYFKIRLGIVFVLYNFLAVFIGALVLDLKFYNIKTLYVFYVNSILATLFYAACAWVMMRALRQSGSS